MTAAMMMTMSTAIAHPMLAPITGARKTASKATMLVYLYTNLLTVSIAPDKLTRVGAISEAIDGRQLLIRVMTRKDYRAEDLFNALVNELFLVRQRRVSTVYLVFGRVPLVPTANVFVEMNRDKELDGQRILPKNSWKNRVVRERVIDCALRSSSRPRRQASPQARSHIVYTQ